jgi:hypothetical protein
MALKPGALPSPALYPDVIDVHFEPFFLTKELTGSPDEIYEKGILKAYN